MIFLSSFPSERIGEISLNIIPSTGKLGIVLIVDLRMFSMFSVMLIAPYKGEGPRIDDPGPFALLGSESADEELKGSLTTWTKIEH